MHLTCTLDCGEITQFWLHLQNLQFLHRIVLSLQSWPCMPHGVSTMNISWQYCMSVCIFFASGYIFSGQLDIFFSEKQRNLNFSLRSIDHAMTSYRLCICSDGSFVNKNREVWSLWPQKPWGCVREASKYSRPSTSGFLGFPSAPSVFSDHNDHTSQLLYTQRSDSCAFWIILGC